MGESTRTPLLLLYTPEGACQELRVQSDSMRIGSNPASDLVLPDAAVLAEHAVLHWNGSALSIQAQRRAVVRLNFREVESAVLAVEDVLLIGRHRLVYQRLLEPPPASEDRPHFMVYDESAAARRFVLTRMQRAFVGIDGSGDAVLGPSDAALSSAAQVDWIDEGVYLQPSVGTVLVNGLAALDRCLLEHGDLVTVANHRFLFQDTRGLEASVVPLRQSVTGTTRHTEIAEVVRIGRSVDNDVVLDHVQVSRHHAELIKRDGRCWLVDGGSTNGTFLNGERITAHTALHDGDRIRISDFTLVFDGQRLVQYSEEGNARLDAVDLRRVAARQTILLHDVSFSVYPRELVGLVGGSGAGKSTLMNALTGFRRADQGLVLLNGVDYYQHRDSFRSTLGYVPQEDIIHRELTVYRALLYAARLRLPADSSRREIDERIAEVLSDLHLDKHADNLISRLSGGQRKRVSIAVELLTRPRLFYLDEPTSGLDPGLEADMMMIFRKLADKGHTVIVITHATQNITLCDKIIFMAPGGYLAFFGSPDEALSYFGVAAFTDIYRKLEYDKTPALWAEQFKQSEHFQRAVWARRQEVTQQIDEARKHTTRRPNDEPPPTPPLQAIGRFGKQCVVLTQRYFEVLGRDKLNLMFLLGTAAAVGWLLCLLYPSDLFLGFNPDDFDIEGFTTGTRHLSDIESRFFQSQVMIFFMIVAPAFLGMNNSIREIARESAVYRRERAVGLAIFPYVASKMFALSLICLLQVALFQAVMMAHFILPHDRAFVVNMFAALFMSAMAATTLALAYSALVGSENKAAFSLPLLLIPQMMLTGKLPKLSGWLDQCSYYGLTRWGTDVMCWITHAAEIFPTEDSVPDPMMRTHPQIAMLMAHGSDFASGLNPHVRQCLGILLLQVIVYAILTGVFLKLRDRIKD